MKASVYRKFGPPEVLHIEDIPTPAPTAGEVLIRIHATTVEKEDPGMRRKPGINGLLKPKHPVLGMLYSGVVAETGGGVTRFAKGDAVYGSTGLSFGACAEYLCVREDSAVALKPSSLPFEDAAALLNGAITAIPFLREKGNIQRGQRVLVNGASGSVGSAAVQIACALGATVDGVCSTANLVLVSSLGADRVFDYMKDDFTKSGERYDIVFDAAGKRSFGLCHPSLTDNGVYLTTIPSPGVLLRALFQGKTGKRAYTAATGLRSPEKKRNDILLLSELIERGDIRAVIDRTFPLDQCAEAHRFVEAGGKRGAVVITV